MAKKEEKKAPAAKTQPVREEKKTETKQVKKPVKVHEKKLETSKSTLIEFRDVVNERWEIYGLIEDLRNNRDDSDKEKRGVVLDKTTGLTWQNVSPEKMTWDKVGDYVKELNRQKFAGFDDWRLPAISELESLVVGLKKGELYGDDNSGPGEHGFYWQPGIWLYGGGDNFGFFWSSSTSASQLAKSQIYWTLIFDIGSRGHGNPFDSYYVRCVR